MSVSHLAFGMSLALTVAAFSLAACRDESPPPRSAGAEPPPPADTKINRAHSHVKTELGIAAEKTQRFVNGVQRDVQHGVGKGADELGVRRSATGIPARERGRGRGADGGV
jgi:hypothetical protein